MLAPGTVLSDRYRLTERIAAGGMGQVWRGQDLVLHRAVAVKVLLPALTADAEFITRFRTEARIMAALRHPGVVQVYDVGASAGVDYLVMEYIDGTPLSRRLADAGRLGAAETMTMVAQVADALQAAHEAGIVHRDVKPGNLLSRPGGALVLVDFGIARSTAVTGLTGTDVVLGSVNYMAPEQAEGRPVSAATDVYALGAVAYCCLTGRPPYVGDNPLAVLTQLVHGEPPRLPADVPPPVAALVLRALAKNPAHRFPSAAAMAAAARSAAHPTAARSAHPTAARSAAHPTAARFPQAGRAAPVPPVPGRAAHHPPTLGRAAPPPPAFGGVPPAQPARGSATPPPAPARHPSGAAPAAVRPPRPARRRPTTTIAIAAVAVLLGLAGLGTALLLRPDSSEAQLPPAGAGPTTGAADPPAATTKPAKPRATRRSSPARTTAPGTPAAASSAPSAGADLPATNPHSARELCGPGHRVIDAAPLRDGGTLLGRVQLLRAPGGATCVVTLKATDLGQATEASAFLEVRGADRDDDGGAVDYYAGPVRAAAPGACVRWGGSIGGQRVDSDFEHCD